MTEDGDLPGDAVAMGDDGGHAQDGGANVADHATAIFHSMHLAVTEYTAEAAGDAIRIDEELRRLDYDAASGTQKAEEERQELQQELDRLSGIFNEFQHNIMRVLGGGS